MKLKTLLTLGVCGILTGCGSSSMQINDFKGAKPEFIPQVF